MSKHIQAVSQIRLTPLTDDQWRKLSVCEVNLPVSTGAKKTNTTIDTGPDNYVSTPYDKQMGNLKNGEVCETCLHSNTKCPGHYGRIELNCRVYNDIMVVYTVKILQCICLECGKILISSLNQKTGLSFDTIVNRCKKVKSCGVCGIERNFTFTLNKKDRGVYQKFFDGKEEKYLASDAYEVFVKISNETLFTLGFNRNLPSNSNHFQPGVTSFGRAISSFQFRPEVLTMQVLPVIPPIARPWIERDNTQYDDDITSLYNSIIKANNNLGKALELPDTPEKDTKVLKYTNDVENFILTLFSKTGSNSVKIRQGYRELKSITSRLSGKDGHQHANVGGKRVDQSARSVVIGGGLDLDYDQLGVPEHVARELTKRVLVKTWNREALQTLLNNQKVNFVTRKGITKAMMHIQWKFELEIGDVVDRQLQNGDIVTFNRQPTLHKPGFMMFRAKIIPDLAFRLQLCMTPGFNADFDGDEMNLHNPQSILANVECAMLMNSGHVMMSCQKNGPVNGLVQDALIAMYLLTNNFEDNRNTMVKKNLVYDILLNLNVSNKEIQNCLSRAKKWYSYYIQESSGLYVLEKKIPGKLLVSFLFPPGFCYSKKISDSKVEIQNGILLPDSARLCKQSVGARNGSIIHYLWKLEGSSVALCVLTRLQKLGDLWLQHYGFSVGISDCITTSKNVIEKEIVNLHASIHSVSAFSSEKEREINSILNGAMNIGSQFAKKFIAKGDRNRLNIMRESGAKGSLMNLMQIAAFVGQQNTNGKRIAKTLTENTRTLSQFEINDESLESRGFVDRNFLDGLTPAQVFFHAMAGRKGIIATAVKTADTGYIQKKISKKLEDGRIAEDLTVRTANGNIVSFLYGGDGMNPSCLIGKSPFFIDLKSLADKLNLKTDEIPEPIDPEDIETIVSFCCLGPNTPSSLKANEYLQNELRSKLKTIYIAKIMLEDFCLEIREIFEKSKNPYGDLVGICGATSVGEPTTQMTLNTFHSTGFSGKDVSLGVPRFNEILNSTKSEKQKKPSCIISFLPENFENCTRKEKLEKLSNFSSQIEAKKFVDFLAKNIELEYTENLSPENISPLQNVEDFQKYSRPYWLDLYEKLYENVNVSFWVFVCKLDMYTLFTENKTVKQIAEKLNEYLYPKGVAVFSPNCVGEIHIFMDFDKIVYSNSEKCENIFKSITNSNRITPENFLYYTSRDVLIPSLCELHLFGIAGVAKTFISENTAKGSWTLDLELEMCRPNMSISRLYSILNFDFVDTYKTYCDDVWTILSVYGIEAARNFLYFEMNRIISFDGTYVNPRHLEMLCDAMTFSGNVTAVHRAGISRDVGPIAKIMFEQSLDNAVTSAVFGESDPCESVSAAVMFGLKPKIGPNAVKLKLNRKFIRGSLRKQ